MVLGEKILNFYPLSRPVIAMIATVKGNLLFDGICRLKSVDIKIVRIFSLE